MSLPSHHVKRLLTEGMQHHEAGRLEQARQLYRQSLVHDPSNTDANYLLGMLAVDAGDAIAAVALLDQAIASSPKHAHAHFQLGQAWRAQGNLEFAVKSYKHALKIDKKLHITRLNLGLVLTELGRPEEALPHFRKAVRHMPRLANAQVGLGEAFADLGRFKQALQAYRKAANLSQNNGRLLHITGNHLMRLGELKEAIAAFRKVVELDPEFGEAHRSLGSALRQLGRLKEAEGALREAIRIEPDNARAHRILASIVKYETGDDHIDEMRTLVHRDDIPRNQMAEICFGLSKALADTGDHDGSFEAASRGNRLVRLGLHHDPESSRKFIDCLKGTFTRELLDTSRPKKSGGPVPVFIVGMPRSGTSLLEQVLSSHSQVFGAGELTELDKIAASACPKPSSPDLVRCMECLADLPQKRLNEMGTEYMRFVEAQADGSEFITDKMPSNFQYLGLISVILPQARIIHIRRDPLDTCLSIFKTYFTSGHPYSYDLEELGKYYRNYQDIIAHWRDVIPDRFLEVDYEDLVKDLEGESRKILEYLGLPFEQSCLSFYDTKRPVSTTSAVQIRQPIYTSSLGLWQEYESHLQPLIKLLGRPVSTQADS